MKVHRTTLHFGLLVVSLVAPILAPGFLMAQALPPLTVQSGAVTGVVRLPDGSPASGIRVTAMREEAMDDTLKAMASLTQTDANGRYRLENVPAGRYFITAGRVDLPTYYPGTLDVKTGTAISIASAAVISDIDFVVQGTSTTPAVPGLRGRGGAPAGPLVGNDVLNLIASFTPASASFTPAQQRRGGAPGNQAGTPSPTDPALPPGTVNNNPVTINPVIINAGRGRGGLGVANAAWWTDAALVARLGLSEDQKKRIEGVFEQHRQALVQHRADLEREEAALARMLEAEPLDPAKALMSQIDRVVQNRAEMERTNSRMTLEFRQVLTRGQWVQLQAETNQLNVPAGGRGQRSAAPLQIVPPPAPTPPGGGGARSGGPRSVGPPPVNPFAPPPATTPETR